MRHLVTAYVHAAEQRFHSKVTRVHTYGGTAGLLFLLDTAEGHIMYGVGVMMLATMDLRKEIVHGEI